MDDRDRGEDILHDGLEAIVGPYFILETNKDKTDNFPLHVPLIQMP